MKIYAIRDRLIDYFMQPFVGPDDKTVQAAVARTINQGEITSDISQAPHHFEIWSLAQVTEDGHIVEDRYIVQDCASLVRRDIRPRGAADADGVREAPGAEVTRHRDAETHPGDARADHRSVQIKTPGEDQPPEKAPPAAGGGYPARDGHKHPSIGR